MPSVFVIRGFGTKNDSDGNAIDFEHVHSKLIQPAIDQCNLTGGTTATVVDSGNIREDMFELIIQADVVVCDITVHNANVFYELGIRHSLRKKHTILIKGSPSADVTPFDLSTDRYLAYNVVEPETAVASLVATIKASMISDRETDSPIYLLLPTLSEADPAEITVTPINLIEEIQRAETVSDVAWLRVIAEDLQGQRFEQEGMRRVGQSQWSLKDWDGAQASWEQITHLLPNDYHANVALANIYERQYRRNGRAALLEMSNQAIRRVLDSPDCAIDQRAEVLALQGRNLKTLWRAAFDKTQTVESARDGAIDAGALASYASYRSAFECDLNAFYPGLAALQMGHMLQLLSTHKGWCRLFMGDQRKADRFCEDLEQDLPALTHVVRAAITRAQAKPDEKQPEWADVAAADLLLLDLPDGDHEQNAAMLVQAYNDAIPQNKRFVWDASIGQLQLFAQLGLNREAVQAVIKAFESPPENRQSEHLIVFAGHSIDTKGMPARFPERAEAQARQLIHDKIVLLQSELEEDGYLTVLASAAPGADILVHEVCEELGVSTRLCLPMPAESVASMVFNDGGTWRSRFLNIVKSNENTMLQLAEQPELPRWLQGRPDINPWERGNRWVMQLAQTWGASKVSMLAFWDGEDGTNTGGTSQFVRMARSLGQFELHIIDSKQILG